MNFKYEKWRIRNCILKILYGKNLCVASKCSSWKLIRSIKFLQIYKSGLTTKMVFQKILLTITVSNQKLMPF